MVQKEDVREFEDKNLTNQSIYKVRLVMSFAWEKRERERMFVGTSVCGERVG